MAPPIDDDLGPTAMDPEQITTEAKRIIDAAPAHGPLEPEKYAKALPPDAEALARILLDKGIVDLAESYRKADRTAVRAQRRYIWPARIGLFALYPSVVLAGVGVYLWQSNESAGIAAIAPVQLLLVLITLLCAVAAYVSKPRQRWLSARADAEGCRSQLFRLLMSASGEKRGSDAWLLALQLECFRRHLLDDQCQFFETRIRRYRRIARVGPLFNILAFTLIGAASLPQLVTSLSALGVLDWLPDIIDSFMKELVDNRMFYALSWVYGFTLQLLVSNFAFISPVARHVERYEVTSAVLLAHASRLAEAREVAAIGAAVPLLWFARGIQDALDAEQGMWATQTVPQSPTGK